MTQTFLRRDQAAVYLQERYGVGTRQGLAKLACVGRCPRAQVRALSADLDEWAASRMSEPVASTSALN